MRQCRGITGLAAIIVAMVGAGSAQAAKVTVGSPLTGTFNSAPAGIPASTLVNTAVLGGSAASPSDGTVVSWQFTGGGAGDGPYKLRIIRPTGGGQFAAFGESAGFSPLDSGLTAPLPTSLPIKAGDLLGFDFADIADQIGVKVPIPGSSIMYRTPPWPNDGTPSAPTFSNDDVEYGFNAVVRYCAVPTIVGRKLAAAKLELTQADCTLGKVTTAKKRKKKSKVAVTAKKKKKKPVTVVKAQSVPAGSSISDTAPIDLTLALKRKKTKA
jgi:hypothetical protein